MKFLTKILIIFITLTSISYAEIIKGIKITGNERVSEETIKVYGAIDEGKTDYSKQDLDKILKNIYETNFFKNVSVEIKNQFLIIDLEEYLKNEKHSEMFPKRGHYNSKGYQLLAEGIFNNIK